MAFLGQHKTLRGHSQGWALASLTPAGKPKTAIAQNINLSSHALDTTDKSIGKA
jgi:hypothetical protein